MTSTLLTPGQQLSAPKQPMPLMQTPSPSLAMGPQEASFLEQLSSAQSTTSAVPDDTLAVVDGLDLSSEAEVDQTQNQLGPSAPLSNQASALEDTDTNSVASQDMETDVDLDVVPARTTTGRPAADSSVAIWTGSGGRRSSLKMIGIAMMSLFMGPAAAKSGSKTAYRNGLIDGTCFEDVTMPKSRFKLQQEVTTGTRFTLKGKYQTDPQGSDCTWQHPSFLADLPDTIGNALPVSSWS